jgi:hypothetical protein
VEIRANDATTGDAIWKRARQLAPELR